MAFLAAAVCLGGGIWFMVRPESLIRTAQHAHPTLQENDPALRSIAKLIGAGWILCGLLSLVVGFRELFAR